MRRVGEMEYVPGEPQYATYSTLWKPYDSDEDSPSKLSCCGGDSFDWLGGVYFEHYDEAWKYNWSEYGPDWMLLDSLVSQLKFELFLGVKRFNYTQEEVYEAARKDLLFGMPPFHDEIDRDMVYVELMRRVLRRGQSPFGYGGWISHEEKKKFMEFYHKFYTCEHDRCWDDIDRERRARRLGWKVNNPKHPEFVEEVQQEEEPAAKKRAGSTPPWPAEEEDEPAPKKRALLVEPVALF